MQSEWTSTLQKLQLPLAALLGALVLAYIMLDFMWTEGQAAKQALQLEKQQMQQAREKLLRSGEEKTLIERYLPTYQLYQQRGLIGAEQRLSWVDGLRAVNQQLKLYGVDYVINPQHAYTDPRLGDTQGFTVSQSDMSLHFALLHENDLLHFFEQLRALHVGLFHIEQCSLQRNTASFANFGAQPNLQADCQLQWLTLQPKGGN